MNLTESKKHAPDSSGVLIYGKRGKILTTIYSPEGSAPFSTIIICHGLPGNEKLLDFATYLRECGFCTISFHYSGSWGSDGTYSFAHCMEDVDSVFDYVKRNEAGTFDLNNIFILGHSFGGLIASYSLAKYEHIKAGSIIMPANICQDFIFASKSERNEKSVKNLYDNDFALWLKDFSWTECKNDYYKNPTQYDITTYAKAISSKPALLISGTRDKVLPHENHIDKLISAVKHHNDKLVEVKEFDTDHGMNCERTKIKATIADFFVKNRRN